MKKFILILSICLFIGSNAQSQTGLVSIVKKIDVKQSKEGLVKIDKELNTYVAKYPKKWLPLYWSAFTKLLISHKSTSIVDKDRWIAEAEKEIDLAMPLSDKKSEVAVLKALAVSSKIMADPKKRGPKLAAALGYWTNKAKMMNPSNPRVYYMEAMKVMATPVNFGGGHVKARPIFEKSLAMFKSFAPVSSVYPDWGEGLVTDELKKIK
jgi:hypothetical protein